MSHTNPSFMPGALFEGCYEILSPLGEGGFGTVYKARQLTTGQQVAIKIMRLLEHADATWLDKRVARFQREMQLCAQLHHPHIVQLIDSGRTGAGLLYSVFSFAPGQNLADLLSQEGPLDPVETRHLMLQVLDALACAHAQGVVHRDLKPRNIMVVPTGARRNAVVLDFGIGALARPGPGEELTKLTGTNEILGTPGYAAPEQLRGLAPSPRSDLFSWGLILLECLTGERVYRGGSTPEILYAQLSPDPVPIPSMLEHLPLHGILRQVLDKDVSRRAPTAKALFAELETHDMRDLYELRPYAARVPGALPLEHERSYSIQGNTLAWIESGTAGTDHEPPSPSPSPSPSIHEGERRQITALCCTVSAFAMDWSALDVEELDELMRIQLSICAETARRHGGHVASALGDQILVYFGFPHAENDAHRAARAALAIMAAIQADSARLERTRGLRLELRAGIHTGLVIIRARNGIGSTDFVLGATPTIAARLGRGALPGTILVTVEAQRLLRAAFELEAQGKHTIEGVATSPRIFRLCQERDDREPSPLSESKKLPLVGREQEMNLLLARWSQVRQGTGQCSLITGEPGIGKSRLGRELRDRLASEPHLCLECRCAPDTQNSAMHPIIDLLGRTLELDQEPSPEGKSARLEARLVAHGFPPAEAMPLFSPLLSLPLGSTYAALDVSPQRHKELTFHAILSLLFAMADEQPVLLLVEDLHWADATTIELLAQLVHDALSAPMCVLLTARPEFSPSFPTAGMLQLHLSRLERQEVEAMVKELGGQKRLPPAVLRQVVSRADGVPLFVEELIRMMVESGVLIEHEDHYELAQPISDAEIPTTLRDLLMARLDRLGRAKETAQIAAALGREFRVELLAAVSPLDAEAVHEDLDTLRAAGLVHRRRRIQSPSYSFKHTLIRDAAYESLPKATRKKVHALIARAIEESFPDLLESRPDLLAQHHAAADQQRQAIPYAQRAAMSALTRSACTEAIAHARSALEWLNAIDDPRERAETELALNTILTPALMATEGYAAPAVGSTFARARQLCESLGASAQLFPVLWGLGAYYAVRADLFNALELGERALSVARSQGDPALLVPARLLSGGTELWLGNLEAARTHLVQGSDLYDVEKHADLASLYSYDPGIATRSYLSLTLWFLGYPDEALDSARDAAALATALDHCHTSIHTLVRLTQLHLLRRDGAIALEQAERIIALSAERGFSLWQAMGAILRGWALSELGQPEQGIADLQTGIGEWVGTGADVHRPWFSTVLADAHWRLGRAEEGMAAITEALDYSHRNRDCLYEAESHRIKGELLLLTQAGPDREDQAEECFAKALEIARTQQARSLELRAATSAARLWKRRNQADHARRVLGDIHGSFGQELDTPDLAEARALLHDL